MSNKAMKQEFFHITDEIRKKIIRQDRVLLPPKKCYMALGDLQIEILNISNFGLGTLLLKNQVDLIKDQFAKDPCQNAKILFDGLEIQTTRVKLARVERHQESVFEDSLAGFDVVGDTILVSKLQAMILTKETILEHQTKLTNEFQLIPTDFKIMVYEMEGWLRSLKERIDKLEKNAPADNLEENLEYREAVVQIVAEYIGQVVPSSYQNIPQMIAGKDEKTIAACTKFIREHVADLVDGAPFANRAYHKPRGYAGDYEMMNHLYRDELVGRSLFDQCMHKYFVSEPSGQAVKNRGYYLLDKIKKTVLESPKNKIRILAVASGPAMEQQLFLKDFAEIKDKCAGKVIEFYCIDQDEDSLKHAQHHLLSLNRFIGSNCSFKFMNLAIKNIISQGLPEGDFDLIYTAGLFDYFTDPVAYMAAKKLSDGLAKGGSLIIGNFSKDNPTQPFMEMVLEWHLLHRSADTLKKLFHGLGEEVTVEQEKLGINLFAKIRK